MRYIFYIFFIYFSHSLLAQPLHFKKGEEQIQFFLSNDKEPILSIPLSKTPFLKIAQSTPSVKETYGFFKFKEHISKKCAQQSIDSIYASPKEIKIIGKLCSCNYQLLLTALDSNQVKLKISLSDSNYNRIYFNYLSNKEEAIFGLGEQHTHSNLKGQKVPIWVQEQGIGAGDQPISTIANIKMAGGSPTHSYAPIPFYLSDKGYAFLLHNSTRSIFDFRKNDLTTLTVWDNQLEATIWQAKEPLDLIEAYTQDYGRPAPLPDWAYGTIVGLQGGSRLVTKYVDSLEASGVKLSAIWIQDWVGRRRTFVGDQLRWYWQADEQRYPNFKLFCDTMNRRGISVLGYINPMLTDDGPIYKEADKAGYLVKNHKNETYRIQMTGFEVGLIDLTNPAACIWIKNIIKDNMIAYGLKGWMADFGEALPWDAVLHSGVSAELFHNQYPVAWARVNREAIEEADLLGKVAFFSRSSFTGGNKYSTFYWAGDQMTSWQRHDGLRSIVPVLTSSGISGMAINHADIGGFAGFWKAGGLFRMKRGRKLLKRHIELAAFTPIFRTHEGIIPNHNKQVYTDRELSLFYGRFSTIHDQLKPYLQTLVQEVVTKGYPMIRHMYLHYPEDPIAKKAKYQYLLGKDILVAPQLRKGRKRVRAYLPEGDWFHYFTKEKYIGGKYHSIKTPIGSPAVFVRE